MTEEDRAERAQDKTEPEYREARQQRQIVVARRKEVFGEEHRQHTVDVKVIPFDQRADRGGGYNKRQTQGALSRPSANSLRGYRHDQSPWRLLPRPDYPQSIVSFKRGGTRRNPG